MTEWTGRSRATWLGMTGALLLATPAAAADKVGITSTANAELAAIFVAQEEGVFAKNGLDTEIKIIGLNPNIPAAVLSDSVQIGAPTPTVFVQAIDNGLDLVTIAGVSTVSSDSKSVALAVKADSMIAGAKDFVGKTVAVPGLNAVLHVTLQIWFEKNGVDPKSVRYIEAPLPTMSDLLKSGQVDGVIVVDPFLPRLVDTGGAKLTAYFFAEVAAGQQTMVYVTTRTWAEKNPRAVAAFRKSLSEAADFISANPDKSREDIIKYFKLPPEIAKKLTMPHTAPTLTPEQVSFWAEVMTRFGLMQTPIDPIKVMVR